jgi:hypothetical protein
MPPYGGDPTGGFDDSDEALEALAHRHADAMTHATDHERLGALARGE